jgi:hypothetical protein
VSDHRFGVIHRSTRHFLKPFFLVFMLAIFLAGCSSATPASQSTTKVPGTSAKIETGTGYSIAVFRGDTKVGAFTLADLSKLEKVKFTSEGKSEEGPTLMSALALVGITDFSDITVYGFVPGRLATAELTLRRVEVNDRVILDPSNQGTYKLAGADIPAKNWIIDVNKVVVH